MSSRESNVRDACAYAIFVAVTALFGAAVGLTGCGAAPTAVEGEGRSAGGGDDGSTDDGGADAGPAWTVPARPDGGKDVVTCATDADCPASTSPCVVSGCVAGACELRDVDAQGAAVEQTYGDCKVNLCDGHGGVVTRADDLDAPEPSGVDCVATACVSGEIVTGPVAAGAMCDLGVCNGTGACVECLTDRDCAETRCLAGYCR